MSRDAYLAIFGGRPKRIPHWEHISNPDLIEYVTGIDPYEKPRTASLKFLERYPIDMGFGAPAEDKPVPRPNFADDEAIPDEHGRLRVRWGMGTTSHWDWGRSFKSIEDVLRFSPLESAAKFADSVNYPVVENRDYSLDEEEFQRRYYGHYTAAEPPKDRVASVGFYNTMFMWPLLTFGWELFLELAAAHKDELRRIMEEFAEINRKVFRTFSRLPVNVVICHDDICYTRGTVCSPEWLREFVYPYYEEFWAMLHRSGKKVLFMTDGNVEPAADDLVACGADGFISEPYANWKRIARRYPHLVLAGEGDNRILMRGKPDEIEAMVRSMVETAKICDGYFMCIGNHIPWNVPPESAKLYFDLSRELAHRE
jgi:hypothetical protein